MGNPSYSFKNYLSLAVGENSSQELLKFLRLENVPIRSKDEQQVSQVCSSPKFRLTFDQKSSILGGQDQLVIQPNVPTDDFVREIRIDTPRLPWSGLQRASSG